MRGRVLLPTVGCRTLGAREGKKVLDARFQVVVNGRSLVEAWPNEKPGGYLVYVGKARLRDRRNLL